MILKIKAKIYQWFGIYLANKEELEYIKSDEFWKEFKRIYKHKDNDMSFSDIQGLLIGMWQCNSKHLFARPMRNWKRKHKK